jgi:hypothetical protein
LKRRRSGLPRLVPVGNGLRRANDAPVRAVGTEHIVIRIDLTD